MKQILLPLSAVVLLLSACAHKPANLVGIADANNSFVRSISSEPQTCEAIRVHRESGLAEPLALQKNKFDSASICEATLPPQTQSVETNSSSIAIPRELHRVVIMGDTGCRLKNKDGKGLIQKCEDEKEWPFARVIRSAQKENADLIIHVGDYHYRESCTDPVLCAPYAGTIGYGYNGWKPDFVEPARPLLEQKPFIFVRGNHEDCQRAHEGFSRMLTPLGEDACVDAQETRYSSFGDVLIVNFDNASVDDRPIDSKSAAYKSLQNRWHKMITTINERPEKQVWIVTHRPIWGLAPSYMGPGVAPTNINMQAMAQAEPLPKKVKFVFTGHIHNFQISTGDHPLHLVVGEGGTALDYFKDESLKTIPSGYNIFPADHGYLVIEKDLSGKWIGKIKSYDGKTDFTCALEDPGVPCI